MARDFICASVKRPGWHGMGWDGMGSTEGNGNSMGYVMRWDFEEIEVKIWPECLMFGNAVSDLCVSTKFW